MRRHSREVGSGPRAWDKFIPKAERRSQQDCNCVWAVVAALTALVSALDESGVAIRGSAITVVNLTSSTLGKDVVLASPAGDCI